MNQTKALPQNTRKQNTATSAVHSIDMVFALLLFLLFTFLALVLIILGAEVYRRTVSNLNGNFSSRTASSYLAEKFRQSDRAEGISVEDFHGQAALVFSREIGEETYATYIYLYEGSLRELRMKKGASVGEDPLESGATICSLNSFEPKQLNPGLYAITLSDNGRSQTLYLSVHSDSSRKGEP